MVIKKIDFVRKNHCDKKHGHPKLIYKGLNLPAVLLDTLIKQVNQILFKFIWGSKWEKIERSQVCCDIDRANSAIAKFELRFK